MQGSEVRSGAPGEAEGAGTMVAGVANGTKGEPSLA